MDAQQSVLSTGGVDAAAIARLSWIMFGGGTAILLAVLGLMAVALRGRGGLRRRLASADFVVLGGIAFPIVTLTVLLVYGLTLTGARVGAAEPDALRIHVSGEQWWWRVRYRGGETAEDIASANEIRIPVGRQVELELASADVIHSFWVPGLAGKVDMIPGTTNRLRLRATKAGTWRGQCAEFCGGPHALMAFHVVAVEPAPFEDWLEGQRRPAADPSSEELARGQNVFFSTGCNGCHTIRGTKAAGTIGPDLTHVGGRRFIGAATLPAGAETFARWIQGNQHIKPNNRMPPFGILSDGDLAALGAYLASLR